MRSAAILACLTLLSAPALAQEEAALDTPPTNCVELFDFLGLGELPPQGKIEDTATGCHITDFYVMPGSAARMKIGEVTITAPDLFTDLAAQTLPAELDFALKGMVNSPDTQSPLMTYMVENQVEPMDIHFAYRWDREARTVELADFSVTAADYGSFALRGRFSEAALDPAMLQSADALTGAVDQLVLEVDNARFMASIFFPIVINMLPYDQDPRPLVANYIAAANAFVAALPADHVSTDSKAALTTFISAFPKPRGDYTLELRADPPLGLADLKAIDGLPDLIGLLGRIQLAASHTPPD